MPWILYWSVPGWDTVDRVTASFRIRTTSESPVASMISRARVTRRIPRPRDTTSHQSPTAVTSATNSW